jgi:hypothetical protein
MIEGRTWLQGFVFPPLAASALDENRLTFASSAEGETGPTGTVLLPGT